MSPNTVVSRPAIELAVVDCIHHHHNNSAVAVDGDNDDDDGQIEPLLLTRQQLLQHPTHETDQLNLGW